MRKHRANDLGVTVTRWSTHYARVPAALRPWLLHDASLTARLRRVCAGPLTVSVRSQRWQRPLRSERLALGLAETEFALVRQVVLSCGDRPWVFARTVLPRQTVRGHGSCLARLGNRPLGELLFTHRDVVRDTPEIACVTRRQDQYRQVAAALLESAAAIWGRRARFYFAGQPLLVSEWFGTALGVGVPVRSEAAA
ncbi:MAG: chorismate lyase [Gammaproteobacteria bacterium]|nr:chorismate lyase [Gammaproteobacteria bacterium]